MCFSVRIAKTSDPETSLGRRATHASLCPCKQSNRYLRLQQTDRSLQYVISNRPDTNSSDHMSDRHQSTFACNISQFKVHSLVCGQTSTNNAKPRNADIRQHLLATQSQFLHLMTLPVQSFPKYVNRTRLGSLHVAPSHSGSLRVPMSSAWHVFPH